MARSHRVPARTGGLIVAALLLGVSGCADDEDRSSTDPIEEVETDAARAEAESDPAEPSAGDDLFPDVLEATAVAADDGTWRFDVTLSSPYDTPERYADAWRVLGPDGAVLGVRELLHDHQFEQPFTRSLSGVQIPAGVTSVTIEGRDQVNGWGGATVDLALP